MNTDANGLPVQADGDATDQLNRVGMILTAQMLSPGATLNANFTKHLMGDLQPWPGFYARFIGGNPNTVSCDQLIPVISFWLLFGVKGQILDMFIAMMSRLGFAQDTHDTNPTITQWKIPDLMFFRAMPIFVRALWWPIAYLFDWYLLVLVVGDWFYQKYGATPTNPPVDVNCTLATLAACSVKPTIFSRFANWLWPKFRNINGAMSIYHSAVSGGNPEVAQMWAPVVQRIFYK